MAVVTHTHHLHVVTRFRVQVLWRVLALFAASAITWLLPVSTSDRIDRPVRWLGSNLTEIGPAAAVGLLFVLAAVAFAWQSGRPAEMGALAWVVAGGVLAGISLVLVLLVGTGPVYWWLGLGVVVTSMALQVLAALAGHGAAVLVSRRAA